MNLTCLTDVGKLRRQNEDCVCVNEKKPYFAIVADGMGGHNAGEIASDMAVEAIRGHLNKGRITSKTNLEDKIREAFVIANKKIYDYAEDNSKLMGMGTTAVTAMIHNGRLVVANVGDSRAYIIKDNEIRQISIDHSYVWQLVMKGEITEQQAKRHPKRNYITRAMGTEKDIPVDVFSEEWNGGTVLLCSDGLSNLVDNYEMRNIIVDAKEIERAAQRLIDLANERGGSDNVSVALMREI